jgi:hypothetical protein
MAFYDLGSPVDSDPVDHEITQVEKYSEWVRATNVAAQLALRESDEPLSGGEIDLRDDAPNSKGAEALKEFERTGVPPHLQATVGGATLRLAAHIQ